MLLYERVTKGDRDMSQIESMVKIINVHLDGVERFLDDPNFAKECLNHARSSLELLETIAVSHEKIVDDLIEKKINKRV